ncbi:hypothetical protein PR202_ga25287 [Eleusine coracana subsp. coracana]|uniref:GDSL esterase/lipase n=1 Tax=Eleusine coracana subsp. coracana TaxID=191504 RepID=A0AAV5D8Z3_ELECO|nr:hypothetical protein PR202_ga25287 [Eleusine coracana subsp. coracana]
MRCSAVALLLAASLLIAVIGSDGIRSTTSSATTKYNALFSFGDSVTETGNICINSNSTELGTLTLTHPPYGMTYFGRPSCRWSNGRVVIDFIEIRGRGKICCYSLILPVPAQALGLPLLPPSKSKGKDFRRGANMAITGATALNFSFYKTLGVEDPLWNHGPLSTQIQWFEELIPSICGAKKDCKQFLGKSLFVFGEFGGNDYNAQLFEFLFTVEKAMKNTPMVVTAIVNGFSNPLETCCGAGGGKYNFDFARCGMPGATTACHNPSARLSWDGVHPTEAANKIVADSWLNGPYCTPPILS